MDEILGTGTLFDERKNQLGEGPVWDDQTGRVYWVDILAPAVRWRHLTTGETGELDVGNHVGAILPTTSNDWIACLANGVYRLEVDSGATTLLSRYPHALGPLNGEAQMRANDAKVSPHGVVYTGTMPYDPDAHPGSAALYRWTSDTLETVFDGVTISNGIGWSPDGRLAYYVDTVTSRIDVSDVDASGHWSNRRPFAQISPDIGFPDGLAVDSEGYLWVALWSGHRVQRLSPDGSMAGHIQLPARQVTSCVFAGDDLRTLVITSSRVEDEDNPAAGATYSVPVDVPGLLTSRAQL